MVNIGKSMAKVDIAKVLGKQYAEMVQAARHDELKQEGARDGLKLAAKRVGELGAHVDKDLEEGILSANDLKDPKKVEAFIKKYIKRVVGVIDNLATTAEVARFRAAGRASGLEAAEGVVQKMGEEEVVKLQELQRQIEAGEVTPGEVDTREAPPSLKHQRQDEAAGKQVPKEPPKRKRKKPASKKKR